MCVLKAMGERISNGELEKHVIFIIAPTINECFEELVKYKSTSDLYIKVDSIYLPQEEKMKECRIDYTIQGHYCDSYLSVEIKTSNNVKIPEEAFNKAIMTAMNYLLENLETIDQEEPAQGSFYLKFSSLHILK